VAGDDGGGYARWVPWAAFALSLVSLGLAIRKPEARPAA